tara:strand:+ start:555 stop:1136 length:582 start_codon:yes stop_codon:yes gene_type:complete
METFIKSTLLIIVVSFLMYSVLDALSFINTPAPSSNIVQRTPTAAGEHVADPVRIEIPKVAVDASIVAPDDTDIHILNEALTLGAVHYPGSGTPGSGNMFLFGHSSNWTYVRNEAYKTFNNIENLQKGDVVYVYTDTHKYIYRVLSVRLAKDSEITVEFDDSQDMLTLSTCNTFGEKEERFVVEADFIRKESY